MADILVVDDQEIIRHLSSEVLSKMGHHVTAVCNGVEALRLCGQHKFDLLILDYHMPDMDGLEMVERLQRKIRFVLHTTDHDNSEIKRRALHAGALGVISKIGDIETFRKKIESFLSM